jgi:hypothetical protein
MDVLLGEEIDRGDQRSSLSPFTPSLRGPDLPERGVGGVVCVEYIGGVSGLDSLIAILTTLPEEEGQTENRPEDKDRKYTSREPSEDKNRRYTIQELSDEKDRKQTRQDSIRGKLSKKTKSIYKARTL